ncbi:3-hydroxybutyrate dehydrogenase [Nakamurella flava]|uniref:3-hydroxybutyrate dehydrogenase n=1 Tax=Nakamurella flava TaxID=2576308 RepID=A0A4U6Q8Y2_9ACTN|nr:3-hydroxybutyrate dehydrogenase [Nakamurella flava]TKV56334.1 3-hydroxybutyrate dehydrogenase [Nakamurella flava]
MTDDAVQSAPTAAQPLAGRTALVTGAASGIGRAIARGFIAAGASVVLVDRNADAVAAEAIEIGATAVVADLSDTAGIAHAIAEVAPMVDILVNNAGIQHVQPVHEFPVEQFELIQRLMVTAPFVLSRAVLPTMYERGWGRIINISSAHGRRASPYKVAYVTAKHGLEGMSKVIALEGAAHGVTSNCINPGYVRTPLVEKQLADQAAAHKMPEDEVLEKVILTSSPVKRLIEPDEVAQAALFLCGPASASITGSQLVMDGGWGAR